MQTYIKCLNLCQSLEIILKAQEIFSQIFNQTLFLYAFVLRHTGQDKHKPPDLVFTGSQDV